MFLISVIKSIDMKAQTITDYLNLKNINEVVICNSGKYVAAILSDNYREYKKAKEKTYVVVYDPSLNEIHRIEGYGIHSLSLQNGKLLYVEGSTINVFNVNTKNNLPITFSGEIESAKWHNEKILFSGHVEKKEKEDDAYYYEESDEYDELYLLDFSNGIKKITNKIQIWEFDTNGETIIAVISENPQESYWYKTKLAKIQLDGEYKIIYEPGFRQIGKVRISKENQIAFIESIMSDRDVVSGDIILLNNNKPENITEGEEASFSHIEFSRTTDIECIIALKNEKTTFSIVNLSAKKILWKGKGIVYPVYSPSFSIAQNTLAFSYSSDTIPPEIFIISENERTSNINESLKELEVYPSEIVEWDSTDGIKCYGILRVKNPNDPLIIYVHGGPTSFSYSSFLDKTSIYLGKGFSVFMPNYRGSVGKGRKYAESNRGDLGGKDFEDIIKGIEYIKKSGKIQTDRLYITGGSYGGYISALAIVKTDIFKASVSLFGISNWLSFHGTSNLYEWDKIHLNDDPYNFNKYIQYSPIHMKHDIKTPILLMHGINDPYVPIGQYYEYYRFLKEKGKEVHLLVFPREKHGFREKEHIVRQFNETVSFFNKFK